MIGKPDRLVQYLFQQDRNKYFEVKELKDKRTLKQNKMMWALIHDIAEVQFQDDMDVYIQALERANAKYEYVMGLESIEATLRKNFRAVKVVRPEMYKGKKMIVYKCFIGSSKMNTKEMNKLIDIIKDWATELNIPIPDDLYY